MAETRKCNVCGEEWDDTGDPACPFCESEDTSIIEDEHPEWNTHLRLHANAKGQ